MATMTKTVTFPSVEWFEALREIMNADETRFKNLGGADITFGVRVDDEDDEIASRVFKIVFDKKDYRQFENRCKIEGFMEGSLLT